MTREQLKKITKTVENNEFCGYWISDYQLYKLIQKYGTSIKDIEKKFNCTVECNRINHQLNFN